MLDRPVGLSVAANVESCGTRFAASVHLIHMLDSILVFIQAHPLLAWLGSMGAAGVVGGYALRGRDLVRRGIRQRKNAEIAASGGVHSLPSTRVPCPECAESILPEARRCPFCRSVVADRI